MVGYFNFSDEASEICRQFLTNIKNAQSNYRSMGCFLATISDSVAATDGAVATTAAPPPSCGATRSATRSSFRRVHDMYSSILRGIKSSHRKVARKLKVAFHPTPCVRAGFAWLREREEKQTSCWADRGKKAGLREREKGNRICTFQL
ncbi:hypothetical protein OsI_19004 [Oryza sativa Indica Group]|uniref:Uncharacterized protein n=1 Tax=Oryza sativa subsp. indica TaxID=39946 RepID=B8AZP7_ORYSI|nr:hypothetical protein OsI_19004 [Oryza sativa Indica Group]